ncbi:hypothetical protein HZS_3137, partial [Henneguya salminicola]
PYGNLIEESFFLQINCKGRIHYKIAPSTFSQCLHIITSYRAKSLHPLPLCLEDNKKRIFILSIFQRNNSLA